MPAAPPHTKSLFGITTDAEGQRYIPSSVRADGSIRKEIRIRPGYRLPEEIETYKNAAAENWKTRGSGGVPGAEGLDDSSTASTLSANAAKNAKRREARKKAKASEANGEESTTDAKVVESEVQPSEVGKDAPASTESGATEREKQARKLKKKLREARDLQSKKEKGETLLHEQFEKVIRINALIKDLEKLGFNPEGEEITKDAANTGTN